MADTPLAAPTPIGWLHTVHGDVTVIGGDGAEHAATAGTALYPGDTLASGEDATLTIGLVAAPGHTAIAIALGPSSRMVLTSPPDGLTLEAGSVVASVPGGRSLAVETPGGPVEVHAIQAGIALGADDRLSVVAMTSPYHPGGGVDIDWTDGALTLDQKMLAALFNPTGDLFGPPFTLSDDALLEMFRLPLARLPSWTVGPVLLPRRPS